MSILNEHEVEEAVEKYADSIQSHSGNPAFKAGVKWAYDQIYERLIGNGNESLDYLLLHSILYSQEEREVVLEALCEFLDGE
jgi:hypothetical protein